MMIASGRRPLPLHISAHRRGYLIRVTRGGITYRASVACGGEVGLTRAIELRDRFLRIYGETANRHRVQGHSNTGMAGVSETTNWRSNRPYPCFSVSWREQGRQKMRRFYYGPRCTRERAAAHARAFRIKVARLTPATCLLNPVL